MARILVVDDSELARTLLADLLQGQGHDVVTAPGGEEALDLFQARPFDAVLTDFAMPGMDGDELGRRILARWPATPVLLVTSYAGDERLGGPDSDPPFPVVAKPFQDNDLLDALAEIL